MPTRVIVYVCTGERTFGVLTKLDLMDKGTNALDVGSPYLIFLSAIVHMS